MFQRSKYLIFDFFLTFPSVSRNLTNLHMQYVPDRIRKNMPALTQR